MEEKLFMLLVQQIETLSSSIDKNLLERFFSKSFQYDNYSKLLSNFLEILSFMSSDSFFYYYDLENDD